MCVVCNLSQFRKFTFFYHSQPGTGNLEIPSRVSPGRVLSCAPHILPDCQGECGFIFKLDFLGVVSGAEQLTVRSVSGQVFYSLPLFCRSFTLCPWVYGWLGERLPVCHMSTFGCSCRGATVPMPTAFLTPALIMVPEASLWLFPWHSPLNLRLLGSWARAMELPASSSFFST